MRDASTCQDHEVCEILAGSLKNSTAGHCVCTPGYHRVSGQCVLHEDSGHMMPGKGNLWLMFGINYIRTRLIFRKNYTPILHVIILSVKSCDGGVMYDNGCGQHQTCKAELGQKGQCECSSEYTWDGSACVKGGTTPAMRIIGGKLNYFGREQLSVLILLNVIVLL